MNHISTHPTLVGPNNWWVNSITSFNRSPHLPTFMRIKVGWHQIRCSTKEKRSFSALLTQQISQVDFIYIAPYHKSQVCFKGPHNLYSKELAVRTNTKSCQPPDQPDWANITPQSRRMFRWPIWEAQQACDRRGGRGASRPNQYLKCIHRFIQFSVVLYPPCTWGLHTHK